MSIKKWGWGCGCGCGTLLPILLLVYAINGNEWDNSILNPIMKWQMISISREWGRLAPLPDSAENIKSQTTGGPFTRGFNTTFEAPLDDIREWLDNSPGTKDVKPVKHVLLQGGPLEGGRSVEDDEESADPPEREPGSRGLGTSGVWYYEIKPCEGKGFAAVWVNVEAELVMIRAQWS